MRLVVEFGDRCTRRGNFGGEYGVPHCNQLEVCGIVAASQITIEDIIFSHSGHYGT